MQVRVESGDNLWKIAKRHKPKGVDTADFVEQIISMNSLDDPDSIEIGQEIEIPGEGPPTPRQRPEKPVEGMMGPGGGLELIQGSALPAPGDLREGVQSTATQVTVDRDGVINAVVGSEVPGPAGSAIDVEVGKREVLRREELARRAALHTNRRLAAGQTKSMFDTRAPEEIMRDIPLLPTPRAEYIAQALAMPSAADRGNFTLGDPAGLLEEGNVNFAERPRVDNGDGTFSTIRSKSFEIDGKEVLVPTLDPTGKQLTDDEAVNRFLDTGEHLGVFNSPESATAYAKRLSLGIGGPLHDPDAFIDLGSPRWREVFVEGVNEARYTNMQRKTATSAPTPQSKARKTPPLPSGASLDQLGRMVGQASTLRGSMGPKGGNGAY